MRRYAHTAYRLLQEIDDIDDSYAPYEYEDDNQEPPEGESNEYLMLHYGTTDVDLDALNYTPNND